MQAHPRLGRRAAGLVDVLQGLAHPAGPAGLQPLFHESVFGLRLQFAQPGLVPGPQILRPLQQPVGASPGLPDPVDGLVGVPDNVEPVDDPPRVGQVSADAFPEPRAHVAGDEPHVSGHSIVRREVVDEPLHRGRVLAGRHVDHVVLDEVGDHRDAVVPLAAGLVDADGLHARVVLEIAGLAHVAGDGPPQAGVGLVDLLGERADRQVAGHPDRPRLEQEREPTARSRPRDRHGPHAMLRACHAWHAGMDERLVPEEVQMPPHAPARVMHRASVLPAPRLGTTEARALLETDPDARLLPAVVTVPEIHRPDLPRLPQLKRGREQTRGIHASNLPDRHHPAHHHPPQTAKGQEIQ